jgi:putative ABC transport system permease protein
VSAPLVQPSQELPRPGEDPGGLERPDALEVRRLGIGDVLRIAARGLIARRLRSVLTALGIAIGIAAMLAVLGITESNRSTLLAELNRIGSSLLVATPGQTFFGADATLPDDAAAMARRIGPVAAAAAVSSQSATVRRTDRVDAMETSGIAVQAVEPALLATLGGTIAHGRFIDTAVERYPAVVLGAVAARRLGIHAVDPAVLVWIGGRWWSVVGILDPLPLAPEIDRSALIGFAAAAEYLDAEPSPTAVYVRAAPDQLAAVRSVLPATANPENPEAVHVTRPSDAIEARAATATASVTLFLGLGAVALLVGGLGIANVMLMAVLERREEIGLRRALGATRRHIAGQFAAEAMLLAGLGGLVGAAIGAAITAAYATSQGWIVSVPAWGLAGGVVGAVAIGAVAGIYPALRAASTSPTDALRS